MFSRCAAKRLQHFAQSGVEVPVQLISALGCGTLVAVALGAAASGPVVRASVAAAYGSRGAPAARGSIAVAGGGIWRRSPDGRLERLTTNPRDRAPAWSRDGKHIAFIRSDAEPGICALFVMKSDGSDVHRVGQVDTDCSGVSWGPRDRQIAFGGGVGPGSRGLWVVNADGSGLRRVRAGRGATEGMHPAWSPDGRTIVFAWTGRSRRPWGRLAAIRPDGRGFRVLVAPRAGAHDDELTSPAWSRDGKRLAYVRVDHRAGSAERTIEVAGARGEQRRALVRLPFNPALQGTPTWSPDRRSLASWSLCGKSACVWAVSSRGGRRHVLLRGYSQPAWGPPGT
jgi:Tol biopolymer transport system component